MPQGFPGKGSWGHDSVKPAGEGPNNRIPQPIESQPLSFTGIDGTQRGVGEEDFRASNFTKVSISRV